MRISGGVRTDTSRKSTAITRRSNGALAGKSGQMRGSQPATAMVTAIMPADTASCR